MSRANFTLIKTVTYDCCEPKDRERATVHAREKPSAYKSIESLSFSLSILFSIPSFTKKKRKKKKNRRNETEEKFQLFE